MEKIKNVIKKINDYTMYGLCYKCKQPITTYGSCRICHFQRNFKNWTSGNDDVDKFIRKMQLKAKNSWEILEWIEYDRFENIEYLAEGGFGTVYKAIWIDGLIESWDFGNNRYKRKGKTEVALKCLHNSQNISSKFLNEV